jgi:hypothetical protein
MLEVHAIHSLNNIIGYALLKPVVLLAVYLRARERMIPSLSCPLPRAQQPVSKLARCFIEHSLHAPLTEKFVAAFSLNRDSVIGKTTRFQNHCKQQYVKISKQAILV